MALPFRQAMSSKTSVWRLLQEVRQAFMKLPLCSRTHKILGFGKSAVSYRRTQIVLKAARLLPAHRRLPHKAFLSGLWWKLLSIQPLQLLAALPMLGFLRQATQPAPVHFAVNGFSAGSYTGAVIALAIRCLWPHCQITARLGAIAMPKGGPGCARSHGRSASAPLLSCPCCR